nr:e3 ubiquitin protein ligase RFWD3 [Hymenolepis microstoma]
MSNSAAPNEVIANVNHDPIENDDPDLFGEEEEDGKELEENQVPESPAKVNGQSLSDEAESCLICFEQWTTSGPHRICCLKCGHLFGKSCITKWIMSSRPKQGTCPQCNAKASLKDLRILYCKKIKAVDTTDLDRALQDLDTERKMRRKIELELSEYKFKLQLACSDAENLRNELNSLKAVVSTAEINRSSSCSIPPSKRPKTVDSTTGSYNLVKAIIISQAGQCRVMASYDYINLLCISQPSPNPLFRGFGIKKVHSEEARQLKYIHLHSQPIRDLAFHPEQQDAIIASASMDKALKLTSLLVDQVVQTYQCAAPIWSCCWGSPSPNYLFAGCGNGSVYLFDIRITSRPVSMFPVTPSSTAPVIALQYIPPDPHNTSFLSGGLLAGQLNQMAFLEETLTSADEDRQYRSYPLPLDGSLVSLSSLYDERGLFLASYRPSSRVPRVRHLCTRLKSLGNETSPSSTSSQQTVGHGYDCTSVASLYGGTQMKMLARAQLFRQEQSDQILAVSGDDDAGGALIWDCGSSTRIQTLSVANGSAPVIDVCAFNSGKNLALLTERHVEIFKLSPPLCIA